MSEIDRFYLSKEEPSSGCLLAMRHFILGFNKKISEELKYGMPFFCIHGRMLCYLWTEKKSGQPYLGIVDGNLIDHPLLVQEKRSRMKIFMLDSDKDLPLEIISGILNMAIQIKESQLKIKKGIQL